MNERILVVDDEPQIGYCQGNWRPSPEDGYAILGA